MRKMLFLFLMLGIAGHSFSSKLFLNRYKAEDIKQNVIEEECYYFPLPAAIGCDSTHVFVIDAKDSEIRVFSKSGKYEYSIGKRGQGPGEFSYPSDIDIFDGKIYVADKLNRRVQVLDKKGNYLNGFKVLFYPQNILVLANGNILVSHLPLTSLEKEKIVHCFASDGKLLWENVDSYCSGDNVYDVFANQIFIERGEDGSFYLMRRFNDRNVYLFSSSGELIRIIKVDEKYILRKVLIPTKPNQKKELRGFCWQATMNDKQFFLLMPEYSKEEMDLIPGKSVALIRMDGRINGVIELPERLNLFCVDSASIYGIDTLNYLRFFSIKNEKKSE